jgi:hypothetical protein
MALATYSAVIVIMAVTLPVKEPNVTLGSGSNVVPQSLDVQEYAVPLVNLQQECPVLLAWGLCGIPAKGAMHLAEGSFSCRPQKMNLRMHWRHARWTPWENSKLTF